MPMQSIKSTGHSGLKPNLIDELKLELHTGLEVIDIKEIEIILKLIVIILKAREIRNAGM